jgi:hypothetical protein
LASPEIRFAVVEGPVRQSRLVSFTEVTVPPVNRTNTTQFVEAGTLETEGFPKVVLSLHGIVRGSVVKKGNVGAILLPEQPSIEAAFDEQGLLFFSLETSATGVSSRAPYFGSAQPLYTVGFQSYRVLLYNDTDKTVTVNLFAYLTS